MTGHTASAETARYRLAVLASPSREGGDRALMRDLLGLGPRLVLSYTALAVLLYYGWPALAVPIAHLARSLVLVSNPLPYINELAWTESGYVVSDRIFEIRLVVQFPSLLFTFGCPVGFAFALPGVRTRAYWLRVVWTVFISVCVCSLALALGVEQFIAHSLGEHGIASRGPWYALFVRYVMKTDAIWDLTMFLYPFLCCALLARSAFAIRTNRQADLPQPDASAKIDTRFPRRSLIVAAIALLLLSSVDLRARHQSELPTQQVIDEIAARTPQLGRSFLNFADALAEQGEHDRALDWYQKALTYPGYKLRAKAGIVRLRGPIENEPPTEEAPERSRVSAEGLSPQSP